MSFPLDFSDRDHWREGPFPWVGWSVFTSPLPIFFTYGLNWQIFECMWDEWIFNYLFFIKKKWYDSKLNSPHPRIQSLCMHLKTPLVRCSNYMYIPIKRSSVLKQFFLSLLHRWRARSFAKLGQFVKSVKCESSLLKIYVKLDDNKVQNYNSGSNSEFFGN